MSSPAVSNNEVADEVGSSAYFEVVYILGASLFYGLSLPVFALSISVLRHRARSSDSKPVRFLLFITYLTLLSVTGQFVSNVGETLTGLSWSQSPSDSISYLDRMAESSLRAQPFGIASLIFQVLNVSGESTNITGFAGLLPCIYLTFQFFAGDAIVVWRASVLWSHSRAVRYTLCLLLTGSAAASIYDVTNFSIILTSNKGASGNGFMMGDAASMFVSLTVNLAATICIMTKAWFFRNSIKDTMSRDKVNKNIPIRILLSLVECGLLYFAAQVANGILAVYGNETSIYGRAIVAQFAEFFAGTYSALVISIVASQSNLENSPMLDGSHRAHLVGDIEKGGLAQKRQSTIQFAPRSNSLSEATDQSSESDFEEHSNGSFEDETLSTIYYESFDIQAESSKRVLE